jgi:hypothetical protein
MYSWRADGVDWEPKESMVVCDNPGPADTGGKLLTALRKSSTVWRQVATDAATDRSHPLPSGGRR